jgi:hypothetical protein
MAATADQPQGVADAPAAKQPTILRSVPVIELVIVRAERGRYSAVLGERVVVTAKEPFFAAARILVAEGFDPNTVLTMRHQGSQTRSLTMPLGKAAKLMVVERDANGPPTIVRWTPPPSYKQRAQTPQNEEALARCELSLGCPPGPGRGSWSCEASAILGRTG